MIQKINKIAIDLTPILPGGENGGAKIFAVALVAELARLAPDTQFILLTQHTSHDELAHLDAPNMQRRLVPNIGSVSRERGFGRHLYRLRSVVFRQIPTRLAITLSRVVARLTKWVFIQSPVAGLGVDLLFCPFTAPTLYEPGIPTVTVVHDVQYMIYPQFFSAEDAANRDLVIKSALRCSAAIATISDHVRHAVLTSSNLDPAQVRTIHHRLAQRLVIEPGEGGQKAILEAFGVQADSYLIYPANFWRHKNHEMLLTAFAMARNQGLPNEVRLVCTGALDARCEEVRQLAQRMGLGDHVVFPGHLAIETFSVLLGAARGLIFPSLFEGFGMPVIEAMALGVPVGCSNVTSLPEIAEDAALLFDPRVPSEIAQTILQLATAEPVREILKAAGARRATAFSDSTTMAREYWSLFEFAMASRSAQNRLFGVHADGWAGVEITVELAHRDPVEAIEVSVWAPVWLPHGAVLVSAILPGGKVINTWPLRRNERSTLLFKPPDGARSVMVEISPSFVPATLGESHDHRKLSIMIERCELILAGNVRHRLYPDPNG